MRLPQSKELYVFEVETLSSSLNRKKKDKVLDFSLLNFHFILLGIKRKKCFKEIFIISLVKNKTVDSLFHGIDKL